MNACERHGHAIAGHQCEVCGDSCEEIVGSLNTRLGIAMVLLEEASETSVLGEDLRMRIERFLERRK